MDSQEPGTWEVALAWIFYLGWIGILLALLVVCFRVLRTYRRAVEESLALQRESLGVLNRIEGELAGRSRDPEDDESFGK